MRLDRLQGRGLGPFTQFDIDFAAIEGRLIAITGGNGQGKSTFLELLGGATRRRCPTRGKLADLATTRDAFVEASIFTDEPWAIRQLVDGVSGKGESSVTNAEGEPAFESGKVRDYDRWAASHLVSEEVFYSTTFAAQGSAGLLDMKPSDRKAVMLRALGIEHLEALAELARAHAREAKGALETLRARLEDELARGVDVDQAADDLATAKDSAELAEGALQEARSKLEEARAQALKVTQLRALEEDLQRKRQELGEKKAATEERLELLRSRLKNNREVLAKAGEIAEAAARDETLREQEGDLRVRENEYSNGEIDALRRLKAAKDSLHAAEGRERRAQARLADREEIEAAQGKVEEIEETLADTNIDLDSVAGELEALQGRRIAGAEDRIGSLRTGLEEIANSKLEGHDASCAMHETALDTIHADDDVVELAARLPGEIKEHETDLRDLNVTAREQRAALAGAQRLVARAGDLEAAELDLAEAQREISEATKEKEEAAAEVKVQRTAADTLLAELGEVIEERGGLQEILRHAGKLSQAQARVEELEPQETEAADELEALVGRLDTLPPLEDLPAEVDLVPVEEAATSAEMMAKDSAALIAVAAAALKNAQDAGGRRETLEAEVATAEDLLADWTRLGQDFGRDGLQALEIDAAGPELTDLVNDLLHGCVGTRWTGRIDTTRSSADGKRQVEGLDMVVIDTERGREALVETYSGGERVILGEALSLALTVLSTRRSGITGATLVRDESGAALDPENGRAYVAMLRRAADLTGADKVLYVSHTPELQELADARILCEDGRVEIMA